MTRHNDRSIRGRDGSWVKNGDRWVVRSVDRNGDLHVARAGHHARRLGEVLRLPAEHVGHHVQLGYASTIHGAQGATVDTTHTVIVGTESRQGLYVALSRDGTRTTSTCRMTSRSLMDSPSTCPPTTVPARCSPGSSNETTARNPRHGRWLPTRPKSSRGSPGNTRMHCPCSPSTFSATRRSALSTRRSSVGCPV